MGDCRVRIHVCASLIQDKAINASSAEPLVLLANDIWSADSTVLDVLKETTMHVPQTGDMHARSSDPKGTTDTPSQTLQFLINDRSAVVWDCTKLPATDVTKLCRGDMVQCTTLFAAGWFPSGYIQVLPEGTKSPRKAKFDAYDDDTRTFHSYCSIERNEPARSANATSTSALVQLTSTDVASGSRPQPSQVLHAVTQRFGDTSHDDEEQANARLQRQLNARQKSEAEATRRLKLDERIHRLSTANGAKSKAVSDQVRRMLVKSRATGRPDLLEQDRIYLHCLLEWPADLADTTSDFNIPNETYRFFSLQDTVSRGAASFLESQLPMREKIEVEMLVRWTTENGSSDVRRLPSTLRFYEAVRCSYLTGTLDTIVVRYFNPDRDQATPVVQDAQHDNVDTTSSSNTAADQPDTLASVHKVLVDTSEVTTVSQPNQRDARLLDALLKLEQSKASKTKKPTSTSEKVRQMQIKSKATGDAKRIKLNDRFFLELVSIVDNSHDASSDVSTSPCTVLAVAPIFVALSDKMDRCVRDIVQGPAPETMTVADKSTWRWELLCTKVGAAGAMKCLATCNGPATTQTWSDAVHNAMVQAFDRVVLRYFVDTS